MPLYWINRNFRFGPLTRASYASPALDTTNLPPEQAPSEISGVPTVGLCRLTSPACRHANDFSDTAPTLLPRPQIFATAIGVLPARHRQSADPPQHLAKQASMQMPLGEQQPIIASMLDQPSTGLD